MLDWDDLRHFLAIARHGTLSGAARALGVQQSTMGRRLDAFEARAGAKLLQKTPAGYVLTPAGEAILGNVERIESETHAVERVITGKDVRLEGSVKLTTTDNFAAQVLMPVLADFNAHYPGIALELITDNRTLSLTKREADIALRFGKFTQNDLVVRKVADIASGVYASRDYLDQHGPLDFTLGALGHRTLMTSEEALAMPDMVWFANLTCQASVALRSNSRTTLLTGAAAGMGLVCLPRYLGDPAGLVRLETPSPAPTRELSMGVHNDIRHMPRIRALTEFLAAALKQRAGLLNPGADGTIPGDAAAARPGQAAACFLQMPGRAPDGPARRLATNGR